MVSSEVLIKIIFLCLRYALEESIKEVMSALHIKAMNISKKSKHKFCIILYNSILRKNS